MISYHIIILYCIYSQVLHANLQLNPSFTRHCLRGAPAAVWGEDLSTLALSGTNSGSGANNAHSSFLTPMDELRAVRRELQARRGHKPITNADAMDIPSSSGVGDSTFLHTSTSQSAPAGDADKRNTRLKEMFKERITAYREAVYLLFGYKVETIGSSFIRSVLINEMHIG